VIECRKKLFVNIVTPEHLLLAMAEICSTAASRRPSEGERTCYMRGCSAPFGPSPTLWGVLISPQGTCSDDTDQLQRILVGINEPLGGFTLYSRFQAAPMMLRDLLTSEARLRRAFWHIAVTGIFGRQPGRETRFPVRSPCPAPKVDGLGFLSQAVAGARFAVLAECEPPAPLPPTSRW